MNELWGRFFSENHNEKGGRNQGVLAVRFVWLSCPILIFSRKTLVYLCARARRAAPRVRKKLGNKWVQNHEWISSTSYYSQVQAEASEQLKEISQRHGYVSGKWWALCSIITHLTNGSSRLIFASAEKVDMIWSKLARMTFYISTQNSQLKYVLKESLISGPLSSTCAYLAKVATSPKSDTPNYQHVMCLYMPDVYDKDAVTEVIQDLVLYI